MNITLGKAKQEGIARAQSSDIYIRSEAIASSLGPPSRYITIIAHDDEHTRAFYARLSSLPLLDPLWHIVPTKHLIIDQSNKKIGVVLTHSCWPVGTSLVDERLQRELRMNSLSTYSVSPSIWSSFSQTTLRMCKR